MKILKHLFGDLDAATTDELLEMAGRRLDHACTSEMTCSFIGEDSEVYVLTVEAVISKAAADHAVDLLTEALLAETPTASQPVQATEPATPAEPAAPAEPAEPAVPAPVDDRLLRTPNGGKLPRTVRELLENARGGLYALRRGGRPDYDGSTFLCRYGDTHPSLIPEYKAFPAQVPGYWVFASRLAETMRRLGGFAHYQLLPGGRDGGRLLLIDDTGRKSMIWFLVPALRSNDEPISLSPPGAADYRMFSGGDDLLQAMRDLGIPLPGEAR